MDAEELYKKLKTYFPNNLDLMRHLHVNACWEYYITENSTDEEVSKLNYFLYKKKESLLEISKENPGIKPDLILYFTEKVRRKGLKKKKKKKEGKVVIDKKRQGFMIPLVHI